MTDNQIKTQMMHVEIIFNRLCKGPIIEDPNGVDDPATLCPYLKSYGEGSHEDAHTGDYHTVSYGIRNADDPKDRFVSRVVDRTFANPGGWVCQSYAR